MAARPKKIVEKIDLGGDFARALDVLGSDVPFVFVTGRAGTGKSTLLREFRSRTKKRCAYLAPTGVAALNIEGQTIHSFFGFIPGITPTEARAQAKHVDRRLYRRLDAIVIDEISMVRADLLDCVDVFLSAARGDTRAFGGLQLLCIGDLYQLPPVVTSSERVGFAERYETPYFFSSDAVKRLREDGDISFVELEKVFRQADPTFVALLNGVRNRTVTDGQLGALNKRVTARAADPRAIVLTATNAQADEINTMRLARLTSKSRVFDGLVTGNFPPKEFPTDPRLPLKKGARVMFVKNDQAGRWVNGSLGTVTVCREGEVRVKLDLNGKIEPVVPVCWSIMRSRYDEATRDVTEERIGSFTQLPLRLAWAVTIHKSQGKTFDACVVDLGRGAFAAGQTYVALSRCRSLDGISLRVPVSRRDLMLDSRIVSFLTSLQYALADAAQSPEDKEATIEEAIRRGRPLDIVYLKAKDEKSRRRIKPTRLYDGSYSGHVFRALQAFCHLRQAERVFNVAHIISVRHADVA